MFSVIFPAVSNFAQAEKFDIATFTPPAGWERQDANGARSYFHSKTVNGQTSICNITIYPSTASTGGLANDFKTSWNSLVAGPTGSKAEPVTETTADAGWQIMTGTANVTQSGVAYTALLVTTTGFGRTMNVLVKMVGSDNMPVVSKFFEGLDLDSKSAISANASSGSMNLTDAQRFTLSNYDFAAPPGWQIQRNSDHIRVQSPQSGCLFLIFSPQPASGDLEQGAQGVFETMYTGWQYQKKDREKFTLSKGHTPQGLEFFMIEAEMSKLSADGSKYDAWEEGAALLIKAGSQIVIIAVRHSTLVAHFDNCHRKYDYWRRFFNSFTVKNAPQAKSTEDTAKRIIGRWEMRESGMATGEYVFAANGNYALIGAVGTSTTSRDQNYEYLRTTTYAFKGDGSYTIAGNQLTFRKRGTAPENARFRFDKVNHGGTGWKDRIHILKRDSIGENEVKYEKLEM